MSNTINNSPIQLPQLAGPTTTQGTKNVSSNVLQENPTVQVSSPALIRMTSIPRAMASRISGEARKKADDIISGVFDLNNFSSLLSKLVGKEDYYSCVHVLDAAIEYKKEFFQNDQIKRYTRTVIGALTDCKTKIPNPENIKVAMNLIGKFASENIVYEDSDNPQVTETAIVQGQAYAPLEAGKALVKILNSATGLIIKPETIRITANKLLNGDGSPVNSKTYLDLILISFEKYLSNHEPTDIQFAQAAVKKLGSPIIHLGESSFIHVASRIKGANQVAKIAIEKKFPFEKLQRGNGLTGLIQDTLQVAIKTRLLYELHFQPRYKIKTNIVLGDEERNITGVSSVDRLDEKLLAITKELRNNAIDLSSKAIEHKIELINISTFLGTIRELELPLTESQCWDLLKIALYAINSPTENISSKSLEVFAHYLVTQPGGKIPAIKLAIAAFDHRKFFAQGTVRFMQSEVKHIPLSNPSEKDKWIRILERADKEKKGLNPDGDYRDKKPEKKSSTSGLFAGTELDPAKTKKKPNDELKGGL